MKGLFFLFGIACIMLVLQVAGCMILSYYSLLPGQHTVVGDLDVGVKVWLVKDSDATMPVMEYSQVSCAAKVQLKRPNVAPWFNNWQKMVEKVSETEVMVYYQDNGRWLHRKGVIVD